MSENRAKHNRKVINDYLTIVRAKLERQTAGSYINLESLAASSNKPDSDPPLTDALTELALHSDNVRTARHVEPALTWLSTYNGIAHYAARVVLNEPTLPAKWENKDTEDDEARLYAYNNALRLIEERIQSQSPGVRLEVAYEAEDEPAASKTEARENNRRYGVKQAYEDLAKLVDKRMQAGDSKTRAVEAVAHNNDTWPSKVWRALASQRERDEAV